MRYRILVFYESSGCTFSNATYKETLPIMGDTVCLSKLHLCLKLKLFAQMDHDYTLDCTNIQCSTDTQT